MRAFDPATMCGSAGKRCRTDPPTCNHASDDHHCRMPKGWGTRHAGAGDCKAHGGNTPNGEKFAAREAAANAVARLGIPVGSGDPMVLLQKAVQHAEGKLEATAAVLAEIASADGAKLLDVDAATRLHDDAILNAYRTGKAAVDANVAERLAARDERAAELLMRFVGELIDRVVPAEKRPQAILWARGRFAELATEYEAPVAVH